MRPLARFGFVTALTMSAGCAGGAAEPSGFGAPAEEPVLLTVRNDDYRDATIFADWNGAKTRVGMVVGKTTETFEMDWRDLDVRLEVDFVGGGGFQSETIAVWAGEHIDFVIMPGW